MTHGHIGVFCLFPCYPLMCVRVHVCVCVRACLNHVDET